jgi:hypothetical protein
LERLKEAVEEEERSEAINRQIQELERLLEAAKGNDFDRSKDRLKSEIKENILVKLYGQNAKYEGAWFKNHPQIQEAIQILSDPEEYKGLLTLE